METISKKGLYNSEVFQQSLDRIQQLQADTAALWGKMSVAQMLAHCAEVQEVTNGKALKGTPMFVNLMKSVIRNAIVNEKPYAKNSPTHPQYMQKEAQDFETQKQRLIQVLTDFVAEERVGEHPVFGEMSVEERGWSMYKHLNHHLEQFGV